MSKHIKKSGHLLKRRQVLKGLGTLSVLSAAGIGTYAVTSNSTKPNAHMSTTGKAEQPLRLGIIGCGIRGSQLMRSSGFATSEWKNKALESAKKNEHDTRYKDHMDQPGLDIEYKGICDLFDVRAESALKAAGKGAKRFENYKDLLDSKEIDAVIIATPDHWHAQMVIDAVQAGKHVYVEKCMTRTAPEVFDVYNAVRKSGLVFQLGHQLRHTESYHAAKDVIDKGVLGKISLIQTNSNRNSPNGAWVYDIHPQANENNIDWAQFNLPGAKMPFDPDRFFRWRKFWDYGTGLFGDLMTHDFDAINQIMEMGIPETVMASGGTYYWKDGREVPDVLQVSMEYPAHGFTYHYSATQANARQRPNIIMGHDATMEIGRSMNVYPDSGSTRFKHKLKAGEMDPSVPIYSSTKRPDIDGTSSATTKYFKDKGMLYTYHNGKRLDPTYLHIREWLECIRNGGTPSCDIDQAFQEAITTHMAVKSYKEARQISWDHESQKIL